RNRTHPVDETSPALEDATHILVSVEATLGEGEPRLPVVFAHRPGYDRTFRSIRVGRQIEYNPVVRLNVEDFGRADILPLVHPAQVVLAAFFRLNLSMCSNPAIQFVGVGQHFENSRYRRIDLSLVVNIAAHWVCIIEAGIARSAIEVATQILKR